MPINPVLAGIAAVVLCCGSASAQPVPVDLELAFVVDASFSIDEEETRLQRQGYADALADRRVLNAIGSGFLRSIAVAYIEFAADGCVSLSVPWTKVNDPASAKTFGSAVLSRPKMQCPGGNAIGDAITFATQSIETNGFEGTRRVIDVSGDGPNTTGAPVELARNDAIARRITINGLVIERPSFPDLDAYFKAAVTGGPRSFVIKAKNRRTFAEAILRKMLLEVADKTPTADHAGIPLTIRKTP